MNKILIISGPTATGKTDLAVKLAEKYNGELISADSRQIYKGMDIGTGKDIVKSSKFKVQSSKLNIKNIKYSVGFRLKNKIPVWLLDVVEPSESFSVAEYQKLAWIVIKDIWSRGKLPILVGGTGFYIKAITDGIETSGIPQNLNLRKKLKTLSLKELQNNLQKANQEKWNSMNNSDKNNPRRLVRAIEITKFKENKKYFNDLDHQSITNLDAFMIGLSLSNKFLYKKIDKRVEKRMKEGIIDEIKLLLAKGYSWDLPSMSGLGYRVWKDYFERKKTEKETIQRWKFDEHNYARRQMTWFKKEKKINWFDIETENITNISTFIEKWLKKT